MVTNALGSLLVVDDEVELLKAVCDALRNQGYVAVGCGSGADALETLKKRSFDLLLTDLMMPEMDGIALLKAALEVDPHVVGIVMTGHGTIKTAVESMKLGAFDYVLKPFKLHSLLPVLHRAMEVRRLRMENVQLRETLAIYELTQTIAHTLDLNMLLNKTADAALQQLQADEVSLMLPTIEGNELYVAAVRGEDRDRILGTHTPLDQGVAGWVARHWEPLILQGEVDDPRFAPFYPRRDIGSALSMPMLAGGRLVGVLNVNATQRRPFTLGQAKGLTILASAAAAAIESARLFKHLGLAEARYRSIFENTVEGIFQSTIDGRLIAANPSLARMYGYDSPQELIANTTDIARQIYVDPKARGEFLRMLDANGTVAGFEAELYRKDGQRCWVSVNARKVFNEADGQTYLEGTLEDITERKRTEAVRARHLERQERLNQLQQALLGPGEMAEKLKMITDGVVEIFGADFCRIWCIGPGDLCERGCMHAAVPQGPHVCRHRDKCLQLVSSSGRYTHTDGAAHRRVPFGAYKIGTIAAGQEHKFLSRDVQNDPSIHNHEWARELGLVSFAGYQIHPPGGESLGVLALFSKEIITPEEDSQMDALSASVAQVIRTAHADNALRESEERFRSLVETTSDWIWEVDSQGKYTYASSTIREILGYAPKEVIGHTPFDFMPAEEAERVGTIFAGIASERRPFLLLENLNFHRDGRQVVLETSGIPIFGHDQEFLGYRGMDRDITERRRHEQMLRDSEAKHRRLSQEFNALLETIPDGLVLVSPNYEIMWINQTMAKSFDSTPIEVVGRKCFKVFHQAEAPCPECSVRDCLASGLSNVKTVFRDNGQIMEVRCSPVLDERGTIVNCIEMARDVTELRKTEEQLRQAQKMEAIGTLAGGIAHDFNNILGIILGYTDLALLDASSDSGLHGSLKEIRGAGVRAKELVQQILAFSRKHEQERAPFPLRPFLKETLKLLRAALPSTIEIRQQIELSSDDGDLILADATQVHQVLMNLCTNAGHAMREGGGMLEVSLANVDFTADDSARPPELAPGPYVRISVSDTGCGMDDKVIERIFEPYFTTKGVGEGTGLGLSVVHGIVRSHEGAITVVSQPGMGTTFHVFFPAGPKGGEPAPEAGPEFVPMGKERILFVDDENALTQVGRTSLERYGYTVTPATDSTEALEIFRAAPEKVDLVITDLTMPQMTGIQLARELTRTRPGLPIILCTGSGELLSEEKLKAAGIQKVMKKPLVMSELGRAVRHVLDRQGSETER